MFILIIIMFALAAAILIVGLDNRKLKKQNEERIQYNKEQAVKNQELESEKTRLEILKNNLQSTVSSLEGNISELEDKVSKVQQKHANLHGQLKHAYENQAKIIQDKTTLEYEKHRNALELEYKEVVKDLSAEAARLTEEVCLKRNKIEEEKQKLKSLEDKQLAYIKERQREEEIEKQKDYYRLVLTDQELSDITSLRMVQNNFYYKEAIDKLIWDVYYKKSFDVLSSHLFTDSKKYCGIYKITSIDSGKSYIGQSVDIKERFKNHIKSALSHESTSNKLYGEMKKYQPCNFTFAILEEVPRAKLNETEKYWIDFYKTKEFGLNSTKGNS